MDKYAIRNIIQTGCAIVLIIIGSLFYIFELSFFLPFLLIGTGFFLLSTNKRSTALHENTLSFSFFSLPENDLSPSLRFLSFDYKLILILLLPIIAGIASFIIFDWDGNDLNHYGTWFNLNVLGYFIPMSLIPLVSAVCLFLFQVLKIGSISILKTNDYLKVREIRLFKPSLTEIPRNDIRQIELIQSNGKRDYIVLLLSWHLAAAFIHGFHLLFNSFAFGYGIILGWAHIITAVIQLIIIGALMLMPQYQLKIITDSKEYLLNFNPFKDRNNILKQIKDLLKISPKNIQDEGNKSKSFFTGVNLPIAAAGGIFLLIGVISKVFNIFAGRQFVKALIMSGLYLVLSAGNYKKYKALPLFFIGAVITFFSGFTVSGYFRFIEFPNPWFYIGFLYLPVSLLLSGTALSVLNVDNCNLKNQKITLNKLLSLHSKKNFIRFIWLSVWFLIGIFAAQF